MKSPAQMDDLQYGYNCLDVLRKCRTFSRNREVSTMGVFVSSGSHEHSSVVEDIHAVL